MEFERNQVTNDLVIVSSKSVKGHAAAIFEAIFASIHTTKITNDLGREIDKSNVFLKFERNQVTNDSVSGTQIRVCNWKIFFLFLNQNICFGTPKNHLDETVLLSPQNTCLNWWIRK